MVVGWNEINFSIKKHKMQKPNTAQKALLIVGGVGIIATILILKSKNSKITPNASGSMASFTGGFPTYNSYMGADGSHTNDCKKLMEALHYVQLALTEESLTPAQISAFRNQEMTLLGQLQKLGCYGKNFPKQ